MNLLVLDIGVTTGWAWLTANKDRSYLMEDWGDIVDGPDLGECMPQLRQMIHPDVVLMEKPVMAYPGKLQNQLRTVLTVVEAVFPTHEVLTPAQWKSTPSAKTPLPGVSSQHARDAIRMGIWWLKSAWDPDTLPA